MDEPELLAGPIALKVYYCQNPVCAQIRAPNGRPHVVAKGRLPPGSFVIVKCRHCRTWTTIREPAITNPDSD